MRNHRLFLGMAIICMQRLWDSTCQIQNANMRALFLSLTFLVVSCNKENSDGGEWLRAEVVQTSDINCSRTILNFNQDSIAVRQITGESSLVYVVKEFPAQFNILGNQVRVRVRKIKPAEGFACLTLGPSYPAIVVQEVQNL